MLAYGPSPTGEKFLIPKSVKMEIDDPGQVK